MNEISEFDKLVDGFLDDYWTFHPHEASFAGIHKYDDRLDRVDFSTRHDFLGRQKAVIERLLEFETKGNLDNGRWLDLEILKVNLHNNILSENLFNRYEHDPSVYVSLAVFACLILMLRDFAPKEIRYVCLVSRLKEIPRLLIEAKDNLRRAEAIPEIWLNLGYDMAVSSQKFFSSVIIDASGEIEALRNDLMAAGTLASKAFEDFAEFIKNELSMKPKGKFASGREYFKFMVNEYHMLPYSLEELENIGETFIRDTTEAIKKLSEEVEPGKDWVDVIDDAKARTPVPIELLDQYRREISETRRFVIENDIVTMPPGESLEVIETPSIHRPTYPYAAYMMPGPFEPDQRGFFWVTPVAEESPPESQKEQLAGHSLPAITVRTIHEGYPGHHLQLCLANRINSKVRKIFSTSVFCEGWALYCEELMKTRGYYRDKYTELIQLKDQLWRACRVVIDVRLHTGHFTVEDAVKMLVEKARLEETSALAEVKRYTQTPTQPLSYLIGKIEMERLAVDYFGKYPNAALKDYHDELLSFGTIPVALVRKCLLGTK